MDILQGLPSSCSPSSCPRPRPFHPERDPGHLDPHHAAGARVIRASVLSIREFQYVEAARALGVSHLRVAFRHILPNTVRPVHRARHAQLGSAILVEATLSFLGLGVPEPYPSGPPCSPSRRRSTRRRRRTSCSSGHRHQSGRLRLESPRRCPSATRSIHDCGRLRCPAGRRLPWLRMGSAGCRPRRWRAIRRRKGTPCSGETSRPSLQ